MLYKVKIKVSDLKKSLSWRRSSWGGDEGYLAHAVLYEMFDGPPPLHSYSFTLSRGTIVIEGYTERDCKDMSLKLGKIIECSPLSLKKGEYSFNLTACPVAWIRNEDGKLIEQDVYSHVSRRMDNLPRDLVYAGWLTGKLKPSASVHNLKVRTWHQDMVRRTKARKSYFIRKPVAQFKGILEIKDPHSFERKLLKGIGRHKGFGYGMMRVN